MKIKCLKDEEIGFSNASSVELKSNYFLKYYILIIQKSLKQKIANIYNCIAFFYKLNIRIYFTKTNWQSKDTLRDKME